MGASTDFPLFLFLPKTTYSEILFFSFYISADAFGVLFLRTAESKYG